jgi:hypothetical protein
MNLHDDRCHIIPRGANFMNLHDDRYHYMVNFEN